MSRKRIKLPEDDPLVDSADNSDQPSGDLEAKEVDTDEDWTSSSSESEDEVDIAEALQDPQFLEMLAKARRREISATDRADASLEAVNLQVADLSPNASKRQRRERPVLLKDVQGKDSSSEDDEEFRGSEPQQPLNQQLADARKAILKAATTMDEDGNDTEMFHPRSIQPPQEGVAVHQPDKASVQDLLDQYFGQDEDLNEEDLFLKRYINLAGVGGEGTEVTTAGWALSEDIEDEAHLDAADRFEAEHNFRFQEPGSGAVKTYPRNLDGVVRQSDTKRASARARKKARRLEEAAKQQTDVQQQKNQKRGELEAKLNEIRKYSGLEASNATLEKLLASADFDDEQYDNAMASLFDAEYYETEETSNHFDHNDISGSKEESESGHEEDSDPGPGEDAAVQDDSLQEEFKDSRTKKAKTLAGLETIRETGDAATVQNLLEEYHNLDHEDVVAGIRTRFPYKQVEANDFGLSTADILSLSDKELNQIVGLNKLAPYKQERHQRKQRFQTMHRLQSVKEEKMQQAKARKERIAQARAARNSGLKTAQLGATKTEMISQEVDGSHQKSRRLATYVKPQLKSKTSRLQSVSKDDTKTAQKVEKTRKNEEAGATALTKSQKKNMWRARKRARTNK